MSAAGVADPQYTSYLAWARALDAFWRARYAEAIREATSAADTISYFEPIALPIAARAALWARDIETARSLLDRLEHIVWAGQALDLDRLTIRAGLAALKDRRIEAVAAYRDALRGWRQLGLPFDEAVAAVELATLLDPTEREMAEAPAVIAAARQTLERLGAAPYLARLDEASSGVTREIPAG